MGKLWDSGAEVALVVILLHLIPLKVNYLWIQLFDLTSIIEKQHVNNPNKLLKCLIGAVGNKSSILITTVEF